MNSKKPSISVWPVVKAPNGRFIIDHQRRLSGHTDIVVTYESLMAIYHKGLVDYCDPGEIGPEIWKDWQTQLQHHLSGWIKMAHKAGFVTTGFEKVQQCLAGPDNVMLLLSEDTSEASISKLNLRHGAIAFMHKVPVSLLIQAFGVKLVKFMAIKPSALCDRIHETLLGYELIDDLLKKDAFEKPLER